MHCDIFHNKSENLLNDLGPFIYLVNINYHIMCDFSQNIFPTKQSELFKDCGCVGLFFSCFLFFFSGFTSNWVQKIQTFAQCVQQVMSLFFDSNINL